MAALIVEGSMVIDVESCAVPDPPNPFDPPEPPAALIVVPENSDGEPLEITGNVVALFPGKNENCVELLKPDHEGKVSPPDVPKWNKKIPVPMAISTRAITAIFSVVDMAVGGWLRY